MLQSYLEFSTPMVSLKPSSPCHLRLGAYSNSTIESNVFWNRIQNILFWFTFSPVVEGFLSPIEWKYNVKENWSMKISKATSVYFYSILQVVLAADHFQTRKEWDYHPIKKFPFLSLAIMKLPGAVHYSIHMRTIE